MNQIKLNNRILTLEKIEDHEIFNVNCRSYFSNFIEIKTLSEKFNLESINLKVKISLLNKNNELIDFIQVFGRLYDSDLFIVRDKFLVVNDSLVLYYDGIIICLSLEKFEEKWHKVFTDVIEVVDFEGDLLVYDELEVIRLDKQGNEKWSFGGMDHFISYLDTENFVLFEDFIKMVDSNEVVYRISYDGKDIDNIGAKYF